MTRPNNPPTPAERAMSCLYETPSGGYAVRRGCFDEFDAIPCEYEGCAVAEVDVYIYEDGEGGVDLVLSIGWGDTEFFLSI